LVEIEEIGEDLAWSTDVSDMSEHAESERDEQAGSGRLDELLHEVDHQLGFGVVVRVRRV
jgi:hypothetical protein